LPLTISYLGRLGCKSLTQVRLVIEADPVNLLKMRLHGQLPADVGRLAAYRLLSILVGYVFHARRSPAKCGFCPDGPCRFSLVTLHSIPGI
jgi:hypothetical protein